MDFSKSDRTRPGDSLSSQLFVLVASVASKICKIAEQQGWLHVVQVSGQYYFSHNMKMNH